jgi:hypothetical protein
MPILDDIMDHDVLGPVLRQGREEGRREAAEAALKIIRPLLEQRLGTVPGWVDARLADLSAAELVTLLARLPEVSDIKDLFTDLK